MRDLVERLRYDLPARDDLDMKALRYWMDQAADRIEQLEAALRFRESFRPQRNCLETINRWWTRER